MQCPTTAVFDVMPNPKRMLKVGRRLRLFGDGFQKRDEMFGRTVWRIPVMDGEFVVEEKFGVTVCIAGGISIDRKSRGKAFIQVPGIGRRSNVPNQPQLGKGLTRVTNAGEDTIHIERLGQVRAY